MHACDNGHFHRDRHAADMCDDVARAARTGLPALQVIAEKADSRPPLRSEDEIVRYYWPTGMGEPQPWFRAAIGDAFDTGIAFAVRRERREGPR